MPFMYTNTSKIHAILNMLNQLYTSGQKIHMQRKLVCSLKAAPT